MAMNTGKVGILERNPKTNQHLNISWSYKILSLCLIFCFMDTWHCTSVYIGIAQPVHLPLVTNYTLSNHLSICEAITETVVLRRQPLLSAVLHQL